MHCGSILKNFYDLTIYILCITREESLVIKEILKLTTMNKTLIVQARLVSANTRTILPTPLTL